MYQKQIDSKSVIGNGIIYLKIRDNAYTVLKVIHGGSAHENDGPLEVTIGTFQSNTCKYKFMSCSGKAYYKHDGGYLYILITPIGSTIDYTFGICLCNSKIEVAKAIDTRDQEYQDFDSYTEATAFQ